MSFDKSLIELAEKTKEIELTTYGRKTGNASKRIMWITAIGDRLYVRSGQGLGRQWPQNLVANPKAILHIEGQEIPVITRHVTGKEEARAMHAPIKAKYDSERPASKGDEALLPSEEAVFELLPA